MSDVTNYLVKETLKDGSEVTVRAMRPDDKARLVEAFLHLQSQTIRTRFFYAKKSLTEDELRWVDGIGQGKHVGLVVTVPSGSQELIIGEGSYAAHGRIAEIGFTVGENWQDRGIASRLLQHLARIARTRGVSQFEAFVLKENAPMLAVFRHSGLPMATQDDEGALHVTVLLDSSAATAVCGCVSLLRVDPHGPGGTDLPRDGRTPRDQSGPKAMNSRNSGN
jgi:GNAT superfamily N-acetyltransferase